jgi:hypothetical protein
MPNAKFRSSEKTDLIDEALAAAQKEIGVAIRNSANPHFKSRFADLGAVFDACRGALANFKVAILQPASSDENGNVTVTTRLSCVGQFYESDLSIKPDKPGAQSLGSAVSYLRRYGLASMAGVVVGNEDDDGEEAEGRQHQRQQQPEQPNGNGGHRPPAKAPWQILSERIDATDALLVKEYGRQESIFTQEWAFRCKRDLGLETASMKDWTPEQIAAASNVAKTIKAEVVDWENKMKKPEPTAMPTTGPELLVYINQLSEKYKDLLKPNQLRTDIQTQGTLARPAFAPLIQDWTPAQVNKILDWLNHYVGVLEDAKVKAG